MKNYVFLLLPLIFALTIVACNNQEANNDNEEKATQVSSDKDDAESASEAGEESVKKSSEKSETAFVKEEKTIVGRFDIVVLSTIGAYYIVYDENGDRYEFFENSDAVGMDFIYDYPVNEPLEELDDKWFAITYENRMIEFYDGGIGEYVDREKIVITKVEPAENNLKTAKIDKNVVSVLSQMTVSGTEPFWSIALNAKHASYSTPSIQSLKLNYLYPNEEATCDLKHAAKKLDGNGVEIRMQDEESGHISVLTIHEEVCNDGMSDNEYPFTVSYKVNNEKTLPGCGRIREK